jgi:alpha/beta hydrolase family protein
MYQIVRRDFLGVLSTSVAAAALANKDLAAAKPAYRPLETRRKDGRYMETAGQLQTYLKHLKPKLAFDPSLKAGDFPAWRGSVREKLLELMCFPEGFPAQPEPKQLSVEPREGYQLQRWEAYPEPYSVVPFLVLVPEGVGTNAPAPAVLCFPGSTHSKESLAGEPELDTGKPLAWKHWKSNRQALHYVKRGFVSVAVENPATCELASPLRPRSQMSQCMLWMGRNYLGLSVFQKACILQWLSRQPMVDSSRVATSGHSLGSNPADVLGVLYPELVGAVIHNDFVCNWQERAIAGNFLAPGGTHHTVPGLFQWFDHTDIEAALAPCPLLFTEGGRTNQIDKIRQAYRLVQAEDCLEVHYYAKYATPEQRPLDGKELPDGITADEYLEYANVDVPMHRFRPQRAVPWLARVFAM